MDDETSSVMFDRYLETLDASRAFFTALGHRILRTGLDTSSTISLRDEDTSPAFDLFNLLTRAATGNATCGSSTCIENHWQDFDFTLEEDLAHRPLRGALGGVLGCAR